MIESEILKVFSDYFCFYDNPPTREPLKNNSVVKRFKKDLDSFTKLKDLIDKFEEKSFQESYQDYVSLEKIKPLRYTYENLIEIRLKNPHWRVLAYVDRQNEMIVMIDAKIMHKTNGVSEITQLAEAHRKDIEKIKKELGRGKENGD